MRPKRKYSTASWRQKVTLCLAAITKFRSGYRVVMASDLESESAAASMQNQDKMYLINDLWPVLIAGTMSRATELVNTYTTFLRGKIITKDNIRELMTEPVKLFKYKLADQYVGASLGISYEEFLKDGKVKFTETIFEDAVKAIESLELDCWLIILIFVEGLPYLFRIYQNGFVEYCEHFTAIGAGRDIAEAVMAQRRHDEDVQFKKGLYHVFEAMTQGAIAPGVSEEFSMSVFSEVKERRNGPPKLRWQRVMEKYFDYLERMYKKRFGPREVIGIKLKENLLEDYDLALIKPPESK